MKQFSVQQVSNVMTGGHTRENQKVLSPLYFGLPGNKNLTINFQYNLPQSQYSGQRRCPIRAEHRESVFLASLLRFPGV